MDLLGSRAIPALALAALLVSPGARAECSIDGRWKFEQVSRSKSTVEALTYLIPREQLLRLRDQEATRAASSGGYTRPYYKAASMEVSGKAVPRLKFLDAGGKLLATTGLEGRWTCEGSKLTRRTERYSGVGDAVRLERLEDTLWVDGGSLVIVESVANLDKPSAPPRRTETRLKPLP